MWHEGGLRRSEDIFLTIHRVIGGSRGIYAGVMGIGDGCGDTGEWESRKEEISEVILGIPAPR
ncbi:hypothetical protein [Scytonema sp. NUACC21]